MKLSFIKTAVDITITLIAVILLVFALLWFVHTFDVFELPQFISDIIESSKEVSEPVALDSELLSLLENEQYIDDNYSYVSVTADKAKKLLSSVQPLNDYFWVVETTMTQDSASRTQSHHVYRKGDRVRIDTVEDESRITYVFSDGKNRIVDNRTGEMTEFGGDTDFSYTNIVNIAALDKVFDYDATVNYIATVDVEDEKYLYVEIPKNSVNGIDKYFISLDYGLVMYASSVIDGTEYFVQKTQNFDGATVISDDAFAITYSETGELLTLQ